MKDSEKYLKIKIKVAGLTQQEVADFLGIPFNRLAAYLGNYSPMPDVIRRCIESYLNAKLKSSKGAKHGHKH